MKRARDGMAIGMLTKLGKLWMSENESLSLSWVAWGGIGVAHATSIQRSNDRWAEEEQ